MTIDIKPDGAESISLTAEERQSLAFRPAKEADFDQLYQYRIQCGWGEARLKDHWQHPDRPLCIFYLVLDGKQTDIGMGGWILDVPDDQVIACRETHTVELSG
jgi:hypothetical protein